jgi:hypothetical protein
MGKGVSMKITRRVSGTILFALAALVVAPPASADSTSYGASIAPLLCGDDDRWSRLLLPDGSPAGFLNQGDCVSAMNTGQSVLLLSSFGSETSASQGLVIRADGTVESLVLIAGSETACYTGALTDQEGNVVAFAVVTSPNEVVTVPVSGIFYRFVPGRAFKLVERNNMGGEGGGTC